MRVADDMSYCGLMLVLQETRVIDNEIEYITTTNRKQRYTLYHSGKKGEHMAGVSILVRANVGISFTSVSERLCMFSLALIKPKRRITMTCAYVPTLPNSITNPEVKESFYTQLEFFIKSVSHRTMLIIAGDFNTKTGTGYWLFRTNMRIFAKGRLNSNGRELLELTSRNDLLLTNTVFYHRLSHITTWESPNRNLTYKDGAVRRNPFRNQIDYILTRCKDRQLVTNARLHAGTTTYSDH